MSGAPLDGYQDYSECVNATHCSWLMADGAFTGKLDASEVERAKAASAALGYDFTVTDAKIMRIFGKLYAFVTIKNTGVAPIYYDLGVSLGVGDEKTPCGQRFKIRGSAALCPERARYSRRI